MLFSKILFYLFLFQGLPIGVYLEAEGLRGEVFELGVDQPDGPAALHPLGGLLGALATLSVDRHDWGWKFKITPLFLPSATRDN